MFKVLASFTRLAVRGDSIRTYARSVRRAPPDPGVRHTLRALRDSVPAEEIEDFEELQEAEPDMMKLKTAHIAHEHEKIGHRIKTRKKIVESKYFKDNYPNLLTWSEKEQIRYLHENDPAEWTPSRIAQSFPVVETVVKKLLKYVWKPASESRIARHDASVARNWRELKENTLEGVTPEMRGHFLRFSNRIIPARRPENQRKTVNVSLRDGDRNMGEYARIIADYDKLVAKKSSEVEGEVPERSEAADPPVLLLESSKKAKRKREELFTFEELQLNLKERLDKNEDLNLHDQMIASAESHETSGGSTVRVLDEREETYVREDRPTDKAVSAVSRKMAALDYPEKINIPQAVWQKGKTYKVDDCYYDDDGLFLYRVPGMTM